MISAGQFILGNAVSFYFKVSLAVLELYSIRLKIIRFILNVLSLNFIAAFDYLTVCWFYGIHYCILCVIIMPFNCKFAGSKFIAIYIYVDGLGYRFIATAIL